MEPVHRSTSHLAQWLDHPTTGIIFSAIGLVGAVATAPFCFGLIAIPAAFFSVTPLLLPAFITASGIFIFGATMISYHMLIRTRPQENNSQKHSPGKKPMPGPQPQPSPQPPSPQPPPIPKSPPHPEPHVNPSPEIPSPAPAIVPAPPNQPEYATPEAYPPFSRPMPPLTVHSSTTWLSKLYDAAADTQKACFQVKMNGGKTKSVRVLIIRGNDLVADSGNATGVHKDWDAVTEAANPNLVSGGNTAGIFYDHYGPSGWTNTDAFKRFRAYQEERREYFKKNETHFRDNGIAIPQPFMHRQIACGEVFTNEGADHGGKGGFQALIHMLGPNTASDMPKLGSGYTNLGREIVRIGAHSVHVTGVSEALYCQDAVACAKFAINNTLNAVLTELENAPVGSVDTEPMYIVFGRYDSGQSCFASDDPSQWTGGNEAYVNNLRQWKVANSNSLVSD